MLNALLEIGCEEIPARFMPGFLEDLKKKAEEKLSSERISFAKVQTLGTYRRLTLYIEGIPPKQADLSEEVKGPPADIAFDAAGNHTKAAEGFARSQKTSLKNLEVRTVGKKNYVFAKVVRKGKSAEKILAKLFPEIISSLYQPLSMRWGSSDFKFIRPIHWIVALCGSKVVKFQLAGVESGNKTVGHRYQKPKSGKACLPAGMAEKLKADLNLYKKILLKLGVMVDQEERKELIRKQVLALAKKASATALIEADLLDEVTFLVEDPIAYVGSFKKEFLDIPQEVLTTSMKKNQKYFPFLDKGGKLKEKFVVVTDGCRNALVVLGNQKVLSARLSDAKFFFEEDKKQSLSMRLPELERVGFFKNLGMISQKIERIEKLSQWIGKRLKMGEEEIKIAMRIAKLCKADLTSKMVYEFPELQGVMGREYALRSSEDKKVAQGIFEHYLPRFADDRLPQSKEAMVVALADRIDSLVGCFGVGSIPTGSHDPYALRRAVHGIIRIVLENKLDLLLDEAIEHSYKLYERLFRENNVAGDFANTKKQLISFIAARLKPILLERSIRYDISDSVLSDFNDILDVMEKAKILNKLAASSWFSGVVQSADRVSRIAKDSTKDTVVETDLVEKEEKELFALYMKVNWEVGEAINAEKWEEALQSLARLTDPIELFFGKVLVMHEDEKLKSNRLALLKSLEKLYLQVADFRKVVLQ